MSTPGPNPDVQNDIEPITAFALTSRLLVTSCGTLVHWCDTHLDASIANFLRDYNNQAMYYYDLLNTSPTGNPSRGKCSNLNKERRSAKSQLNQFGRTVKLRSGIDRTLLDLMDATTRALDKLINHIVRLKCPEPESSRKRKRRGSTTVVPLTNEGSILDRFAESLRQANCVGLIVEYDGGLRVVDDFANLNTEGVDATWSDLKYDIEWLGQSLRDLSAMGQSSWRQETVRGDSGSGRSKGKGKASTEPDRLHTQFDVKTESHIQAEPDDATFGFG